MGNDLFLAGVKINPTFDAVGVLSWRSASSIGPSADRITSACFNSIKRLSSGTPHSPATGSSMFKCRISQHSRTNL